MLADGFGIHAKFVGKLLPDPNSGRLVVEFNDLPQLPFDQFDVHIFASDRGIFATPTHCAVYAVQTNLFPWNSQLPDQRSQFGVSVTSGSNGKSCPAGTRPFSPKLEAGTSNSNAGSFSNFTLKLDRDDGDQYLDDLGFTMPPGLTGSLKGISYCPESGIASASQKLGRTEQAIPSARPLRRWAPPTSPRAQGVTPSTLTGRCTWRGRSREHRFPWSRSPRPWRVPMTTESS